MSTIFVLLVTGIITFLVISALKNSNKNVSKNTKKGGSGSLNNGENDQLTPLKQDEIRIQKPE
jgi:hypothetical protein